MLITFTAQSVVYNSTVPLTDCYASLQLELWSGLAAEGEVGDEETVWVSAAVVAAARGAAVRFLCATAPL